MSRTVTALFDSRSEAEAAKQRLTSSRIDADNIRIIDKESRSSSANGSSGDAGDQGFWASLKDLFGDLPVPTADLGGGAVGDPLHGHGEPLGLGEDRALQDRRLEHQLRELRSEESQVAVVLPDADVPRSARAAYAAAREIPQLLDGLRCHCECAARDGLRSLLSCFESRMPTSCGICRDEALLALRLHREGRTLDEIRAAVDEEFG